MIISIYRSIYSCIESYRKHFWGIGKYRIAGYENQYRIESWRTIRFTTLMNMLWWLALTVWSNTEITSHCFLGDYIHGQREGRWHIISSGFSDDRQAGRGRKIHVQHGFQRLVDLHTKNNTRNSGEMQKQLHRNAKHNLIMYSRIQYLV